MFRDIGDLQLFGIPDVIHVQMRALLDDQADPLDHVVDVNKRAALRPVALNRKWQGPCGVRLDLVERRARLHRRHVHLAGQGRGSQSGCERQ